MKIRLLSFCFNEVDLLPYFFRHYDTFVNEYIIYDNESTDGSSQIIKNHPNVDYRILKTNKTSDVYGRNVLRNTVWKENKENFDWQIVCDIDEFLYFRPGTNYKNTIEVLEYFKKNEFWIPETNGYQMCSMKFPTTSGQIYEEINKGIYEPLYSKNVIFNPNKIENINYEIGAHKINPKEKIKYDLGDRKFKLLHYKFIGLDFIMKKCGKLLPRLNEKSGKDPNFYTGLYSYYQTWANWSKKELTEYCQKATKVI